MALARTHDRLARVPHRALLLRRCRVILREPLQPLTATIKKRQDTPAQKW